MKTSSEDGVVHVEQGLGETMSLDKNDVLQLEHTDPVLNAKMHLVNDAIDEVSEFGLGVRWQMQMVVVTVFRICSAGRTTSLLNLRIRS
jgi:hypothetical protein